MSRSWGLTLAHVVPAIVILVTVHGQRAYAQSAGVEAEALFRHGKELMTAGKISEACAAFDLSQKLDPRVTTLLNQANCRERNGQLATAWGLFLEAARQTRAATDAKGRQLHTVASDHAAKLEPRLSTLRIDVPSESQISGLEISRDGHVVEPAAWNKALPLDGGAYRISARAPGAIEWSSDLTVATDGESKRIVIPKLRPAESPQPTPVSKPTTTMPASNQVDHEPREPSSVWTGRRKLAVGVAAGGVVTFAIGAVLGASAKSKQRDAHALCPSRLDCEQADRANDLIRSGHNLAIEANVAFGVAAAAVIAAGTLWFTGAPESRPRVAVIPSTSPGQVLLTATGSF
jgi:hypothetical protein